jgi:hypothetical protein
LAPWFEDLRHRRPEGRWHRFSTPPVRRGLPSPRQETLSTADPKTLGPERLEGTSTPHLRELLASRTPKDSSLLHPKGLSESPTRRTHHPGNPKTPGTPGPGPSTPRAQQGLGVASPEGPFDTTSFKDREPDSMPSLPPPERRFQKGE